MGKSLEYALKVMPTKEAGRRNVIELGATALSRAEMGDSGSRNVDAFIRA